MNTRAKISAQNVGANAVKTAPTPKMAKPVMWIFLRPTMSAKRPIGNRRALITSASLMTTQLAERSDTPKSSAIADRATNTIDIVITMVKNDSAIAKNARHL